MTSSSSSLNNIKIEIRSLLVSSQIGLREDELCRDYSLFNSQRSLPYEIFGYSSVTDFLNSLTDILYRSFDGLIHPIVDQSTEHIFKLVQQQRTNKKKKSRVNNHQIYIQQIKVRSNKQKRSAPLMVTSSQWQQIHRTADTKKPCSTQKQIKILHENKVKQSFYRQKSVVNEPLPKLERIHVTNDLLKRLLLHFHQQQRQ